MLMIAAAAAMVFADSLQRRHDVQVVHSLDHLRVFLDHEGQFAVLIDDAGDDDLLIAVGGVLQLNEHDVFLTLVRDDRAVAEAEHAAVGCSQLDDGLIKQVLLVHYSSSSACSSLSCRK